MHPNSGAPTLFHHTARVNRVIGFYNILEARRHFYDEVDTEEVMADEDNNDVSAK